MANVARAAVAAKLLQKEVAASSKPLLENLKEGLGALNYPSLQEMIVNVNNSPVLQYFLI